MGIALKITTKKNLKIGRYLPRAFVTNYNEVYTYNTGAGKTENGYVSDVWSNKY